MRHRRANRWWQWTGGRTFRRPCGGPGRARDRSGLGPEDKMSVSGNVLDKAAALGGGRRGGEALRPGRGRNCEQAVGRT